MDVPPKSGTVSIPPFMGRAALGTESARPVAVFGLTGTVSIGEVGGGRSMSLKRISPEEARDLLESGEGYVYLDVRSIPEFEAGHAPGAKNIPLLHRTPAGMQPNHDFVAVCETALGRDAKIITACLKGGRSMRAAQVLLANGFENVVDMRGGFHGESDMTGALTYPGWAPRGLPVTTDASEDETYESLAQR